MSDLSDHRRALKARHQTARRRLDELAHNGAPASELLAAGRTLQKVENDLRAAKLCLRAVRRAKKNGVTHRE